MGIMFEYQSQEKVSDEVASAILAAVHEPDSQPWILCEPIHFYGSSGEQGRLLGASKLNLQPHPDDRAAAQVYLSDRDDLTFVVDRLCQWSREHGVDWNVLVEGEQVGEIVAGESDQQLREVIAGLVEAAQLLADMGGLDDFE